MAGVSPTDYRPAMINSPQEQHPVRASKVVSQIGASSIAESQMTETVMTLKSEYGDNAMQLDSTLHEDTIAGWKVQRTATRPGSRLNGTSDLTDGQ